MKTLALRIAAGIAMFGLVQLAAYLFLWQPRFEEIESAQASEEKLKQDYVAKKKQAVNLPLHQQQLGEIDASLGAVLRMLPGSIDADALKQLGSTAARAGLTVEQMRPSDEELRREFYAERQVSMRMSGRYHELGAFASDLARLQHVVTLADLTLDSPAKDGRLQIGATARFFRYLDDEEIAAERRAAAKKRGPKK